MENFSIYALKGDPVWNRAIFDSLQKGEGRYGWSTVESADLYVLRQRIETDGWSSLSNQEKNCYQDFLLDLKIGDYVVYINVPTYGKCTLAKVSAPYFWRWDGEDADFNHRFLIDTETILTFDRNHALVRPALSARLKLQGRYWRIHAKKEFLELLSLPLYSMVETAKRNISDNKKFLRFDIKPLLLEITKTIQETNPNTDLERLIAEAFERVPNVKEVKLQGGAGDHGADILLTYESGLPIAGLEIQSQCVVQVKSFQGVHDNLQAVKDIERAFNRYPNADMGMIVSTGKPSEALEAAISELQEKSKKPIRLLANDDLAAFILKYIDF
jgi:Restriction endonuclease